MPKLLLINPSNIHKGLGNIRSTAWPPLNLPYLAAITPIHYQIEVIDENIDIEEETVIAQSRGGTTSYFSKR